MLYYTYFIQLVLQSKLEGLWEVIVNFSNAGINI